MKNRILAATAIAGSYYMNNRKNFTLLTAICIVSHIENSKNGSMPPMPVFTYAR